MPWAKRQTWELRALVPSHSTECVWVLPSLCGFRDCHRVQSTWKYCLMPSTVLQHILGCMNLIRLRYTISAEDTTLFNQNTTLYRNKKSISVRTEVKSILPSGLGISSQKAFTVGQPLRWGENLHLSVTWYLAGTNTITNSVSFYNIGMLTPKSSFIIHRGWHK